MNDIVGWHEELGGVVIRFPDPRKNEPYFDYCTKVAAFNLDNTIMESKPKLIFNRFAFDFMFQNCIQKIQDLHKSGYSIVIISDQDAISRGFMTIEDLQYKFNYLVGMLADKRVPVIGIFTTKNNCFKKPHTRTWKLLMKLYAATNKSIDMKESFYVGNLAGRVAKTPFKKDFDYVDRAFAHNLGLEFKVPEQIFRHSVEAREFKYENIMDDKEKDEIIVFEYERYRRSPFFHTNGHDYGLLSYCYNQSKKMMSVVLPVIPENSDEKIATTKIVSSNNVVSFMIIMVGPPSCGKTFLANCLGKRISKKVIGPDGKESTTSPIIVIEDKHKIESGGKPLSKTQRDSLIDECIRQQRIIILDSNYASHESRNPYLEKAVEYNLPVFFFKFDTPYKICRHFNHMKFEATKDYTKEPLTPYVFKKYNRTYQPPDISIYKHDFPSLNALIVNIPTLIIDSKAFRNIY